MIKAYNPASWICLFAACLLLSACARTTGGEESEYTAGRLEESEAQTEEALSVAVILTEEPLHAVWNWRSGTETDIDTDVGAASECVGDQFLRRLLYGDTALVQQQQQQWSQASEESGWNLSVLAEEPAVTEETDGTRSVTISLREGVRWSDGEPLTAEDYVLAYALFSQGDIAASSYFEEIAARLDGRWFAGYEAYRNSTAAEAVAESTADIVPFAGVRLLDEYRFCCTVTEEYADVPLTELMAICPYPAHIWLPQEVHVLDDGSGLFLSSAAREALMTRHFQETEAQDGDYICAGAYYIESWDEEGQEVILCRNPYSDFAEELADIFSGIVYDKLELRSTSQIEAQAAQLDGGVYVLDAAGILELYEPQQQQQQEIEESE